MTDLALLPATELARRLRRREVSSLELLQHHLRRIERLNPALNAVVVLDTDVALQRARDADAALARGESWGPLHGLPMTVKESFDLPGLPTTWGFEAHARQHRHAARGGRAAAARRRRGGLRQDQRAGGAGRLAELQPGLRHDEQPLGPDAHARRLFGRLGRRAGRGLSALELGSDIGASIRNPAHYCGVWGHKPTWGVVPIEGHQLPGDECADMTDIAAAGPLARSAHDLTLAMDILATPLARSARWAGVPAAWRDAGVPPPRLRIAVHRRRPGGRGGRQRARAVCPSWSRSCAQRRDGGRSASARWTAPRPGGPMCRWCARPTSAHLTRTSTPRRRPMPQRSRRAAAEFPAMHWRGLTLAHRDWVQLDEVRSRLRRQWAAFFERWDLLICPVATTAAFKHNQQGFRWQRMVHVNGRDQPSTTSLFWAGYTNLCGLPATAVPLGLSEEGLPIGAQVFGPVFADPVCLRFARWLEAEYRAFVPPPMAE